MPSSDLTLKIFVTKNAHVINTLEYDEFTSFTLTWMLGYKECLIGRTLAQGQG